MIFVRFILSFARSEASGGGFPCDFQVMLNGRVGRICPKIGGLKIFFELMEKRQNIEIAQNIDPPCGAFSLLAGLEDYRYRAAFGAEARHSAFLEAT